MPRLATGLIARPRLFALLELDSPVTLVCAPAASGKTMLVSSWLRSAAPGAVAWVGVEREEADAVRFWSAVIDAVGSGATRLVRCRAPERERVTDRDRVPGVAFDGPR